MKLTKKHLKLFKKNPPKVIYYTDDMGDCKDVLVDEFYYQTWDKAYGNKKWNKSIESNCYLHIDNIIEEMIDRTDEYKEALVKTLFDNEMQELIEGDQ